jgi:arabinofuranan 3-O-arabinosyltransferase
MTTTDVVAREGRVRRLRLLGYALLALLAYVPVLLTKPGKVVADTKSYLYLDPGRLLERAVSMWDPHIGMGTVTHQNIGYLWPMGPYYWVTNQLGIPNWVAQRFWMGSIMFLAAAGAYFLFRSLWGDRRAAVVGGLAYGLSPFVLGHITGQSALLLPFSALPWLIIAARNSLRGDPWRWAAVFALIATTAGSLNGSSMLFVIFGAVLWIPYAVWWERSASVRSGITALLRMGGLTLVTQLVVDGAERRRQVRTADPPGHRDGA